MLNGNSKNHLVTKNNQKIAVFYTLLILFLGNLELQSFTFYNKNVYSSNYFSPQKIENHLNSNQPKEALELLREISANENHFICDKKTNLNIFKSECITPEKFDSLLIKTYSQLKSKNGTNLIKEFYFGESTKTNRVIKAYFFSKRRIFDTAIKFYDSLLLNYPENLLINEQLAKDSIKAKNYDIAIATYERLMILDESNSEYYFDLIDIYFDLDMDLQAKATFNELKELNLFYSDAQKQERFASQVLEYEKKFHDRKKVFFVDLFLSNKIGFDDNIRSSTTGTNMAEFLTLEGYSDEVIEGVQTEETKGSFYYSPSLAIAMKYKQFMASIFGNYQYFQEDQDLNYYLTKMTVGYFEKKSEFPFIVNFGHLHINYGNKPLLNIFSLDSTVRYAFSKKYMLSLYSEYQRTYYTESSNTNRDNDNLIISPSLMMKIDPKNFFVFNFKTSITEIAKESENVDYMDYISTSFKLLYGYKQQYFSGNVYYQNKGIFYNSKVGITSDERIDVTNNFGGIISYTLNSWSSISLNYDYFMIDSNFPISRYSKNNISLVYSNNF